MKVARPNGNCPVCGFTLEFIPWNGDSAADEICPCCGIQFGYDDFAGGNHERRQTIYTRWRQQWTQNGMRWSSKGIAPPPEWNAEEQLRGMQHAVTKMSDKG